MDSDRKIEFLGMRSVLVIFRGDTMSDGEVEQVFVYQWTNTLHNVS